MQQPESQGEKSTDKIPEKLTAPMIRDIVEKQIVRLEKYLTLKNRSLYQRDVLVWIRAAEDGIARLKAERQDTTALEAAFKAIRPKVAEAWSADAIAELDLYASGKHPRPMVNAFELMQEAQLSVDETAISLPAKRAKEIEERFAAVRSRGLSTWAKTLDSRATGLSSIEKAEARELARRTLRDDIDYFIAVANTDPTAKSLIVKMEALQAKLEK